MSKNVKLGKFNINIVRFGTICIAIILVILLVLIFLNVKKPIDNNTDISKLNSGKYSKELLEEYNKEGKKEEFLKGIDELQSSIAIYILENSTMEPDSFTNILKDLSQKFEKGKTSDIGIHIPTTWNGKWILDKEGKVAFKFSSKEITPNWAYDAEFKDKIIE